MMMKMRSSGLATMVKKQVQSVAGGWKLWCQAISVFPPFSTTKKSQEVSADADGVTNKVIFKTLPNIGFENLQIIRYKTQKQYVH